jgi:hypothetical protein
VLVEVVSASDSKAGDVHASADRRHNTVLNRCDPPEVADREPAIPAMTSPSIENL